MVDIPRDFRLLEELGIGERSEDIPYGISYGLKVADDRTLTEWVGAIPGPENTRFADRLINVEIVCGQQYPKQPPEVRMISRVNLPLVNSDGRLDKSFPILKDWDPKTTIRDILVELYKHMQNNRSLRQPPDGQTY